MKKIKIYLFMLFALMAIGSGAYIYITDLKNTIQDQENTIAVQLQNEQALQDQLEMKADSLQDYAVFVKNLNAENADIERKYILITSKYNILVDSAKIWRAYAEVDTSGNTIIIRFSGRVVTIEYEGQTVYDKVTGEGTHSITIAVDPIKIRTETYLDKENKRIRIFVYANGALIDSANTVMDSTAYLLIINDGLDRPKEPGILDNIHLTVGVNTDIVKEGPIWKPGEFSIPFGIEYQHNRFLYFVKYDVINQGFNVGVTYGIPFSDFLPW